MRLTRILGFALALAALAACGDITGNKPATSKVALVTITPNFAGKDTIYRTEMFFGDRDVDTSYNLGTSTLFGGTAMIVDEGKTVSVYTGVTGASGMRSDGKVAPSFRILSDWNVVEPEKHKGVTFGNTTEFIFRVGGWNTDASGNLITEMPYKLYTANAHGENPSAKLTLPAVMGYQFVYPFQKFTFGFTGDDSLTIHSANGFVVAYHSLDGDYTDKARAIGDITLTVKTYASAVEAGQARTAFLNKHRLK